MSSFLRASSPLVTEMVSSGSPCRIASRAIRFSLRSSTASTLACITCSASHPLHIRYPGGYDRKQLVKVDGLRDVVGSAGRQAGLPVAGHRLGGQEHHR